MKICGRSFAVLGLGISGSSAVRFLLKRGAAVVWGIDRDSSRLPPLVQEGMQPLSEGAPLPKVDYLIVSPGVPPEHPVYRAAKAGGVPILGEVELALRHCNKKLLGVTGTNGKTTVTLLTAHLLNEKGVSARAVGNVGLPITSQLESGEEVFVVELSSYQLETLSQPLLSAAVLLNITPDHLDRYETMEAYAKAKCRISGCLKPGGALFVESSCYDRWGELITGSEIQLLEGADHHLLNQRAALALCSAIGVDASDAVESFIAPPHRIERVCTIGGVTYYNDSKGTNVAAVLCAVQSLPPPIFLIVGGQAKGADFSPWIPAFRGKVAALFTIGEAGEALHALLSPYYRTECCHTLKEAVNCASALAQPKGNVLLSPGCASFDQFRDYCDRGEQFKRLVKGEI